MADFLSEAKRIEKKLIEHRRYLHQNAEIGFDLSKTCSYVRSVLNSIGCEVFNCGSCGVYTVIGKNNLDKCVLLRADMDALPINEEADISFKSNSNMHACGHDMHTAMLLGAAEIIKRHENELKRPVKLIFQPAEETLEGAKNMIESEILLNPQVKSAFMLHCIVNTPLKVGTIIINSGGISAPSADYFEIKVIGKGCHGAMPNSGIDPIICSANIISALDSIKTRELSLYDSAALTIGSVNAGSAHNVIPNTATIKGTLRCFNENVRNIIKESIIRIATNISKAYKSTAEINFIKGCPCLNNDTKLSQKAKSELINQFGERFVIDTETVMEESSITERTSGSEDFAYFSEKVPFLMIAISAGCSTDGYIYPLHHPKTVLDERALIYGTAAYATIGLKI